MPKKRVVSEKQVEKSARKRGGESEESGKTHQKETKKVAKKMKKTLDKPNELWYDIQVAWRDG